MSRASQTVQIATGVLLGMCATQCDAVLGADFEDLELRPQQERDGATATGGTTSDDGGALDGGAGGTSSGGTGQVSGTGGDTQTGGTSGSSQSGGTSAGGQAGSTTTGGAGGGSSGNGGQATGGSGNTSSGGSGGTTECNGLGPANDAVVLNELRAAGDDMIELYNAADVAVNLGGYAVAEDAGGTPNLASLLRFPACTAIGPKGYLVVTPAQLTSGGPFTTCCCGVALCYYATFPMSAAQGGTFYLLRPDDTVRDVATAPPGLTAGQSWARIPDGGEFQAVGAGTPGLPNQL